MNKIQEGKFWLFFKGVLIFIVLLCFFVIFIPDQTYSRSALLECREEVSALQDYVTKLHSVGKANHKVKGPLRQKEAEKTQRPKSVKDLDIHLESNEWLPEGYFGNNITAWPVNVVPDIVHYILYGTAAITFSHMVSIFSVLRNHKPEVIYIHCDCQKIANDANWMRIMNYVNETNTTFIQVNTIQRPTEIYGIKIEKVVLNWHASNIMRYRILAEYGGIFLENDVYVCQPLDQFLKFEFTLNWDQHQFIGQQVLIANKNARFLKFVLETYRLYQPAEWDYNSRELPTTAILYKYPQLVHRVKEKFGANTAFVCSHFYRAYHPDWMDLFYIFHMVLRGNRIYWINLCDGREDEPDDLDNIAEFDFNLESIKTLNTTFGEMARWALYGVMERIHNNTALQ